MPAPNKLRDIFLSRMLPQMRDAWNALADLDIKLAKTFSNAVHDNPGVGLNAEDFVAYLAERIPLHAPATLDGIRTSELYLACACSQQQPQALELFRRRHLKQIRWVVATFRGSSALADDVEQRVLEIIFLGTPQNRPRIRDYSGRGSLNAWIRGIALRTGMNLTRRDRPTVEDDALLNQLADRSDPELLYANGFYARELRAAFGRTLREMPRALLGLLRQYYLDGVNLEQLAKIHGVHPATISRRLSDARTHLLNRTRQAAAKQLQITREEFESIVKSVISKIDISSGAWGPPHTKS